MLSIRFGIYFSVCACVCPPCGIRLTNSSAYSNGLIEWYMNWISPAPYQQSHKAQVNWVQIFWIFYWYISIDADAPNNLINCFVIVRQIRWAENPDRQTENIDWRRICIFFKLITSVQHLLSGHTIHSLEWNGSAAAHTHTQQTSRAQASQIFHAFENDDDRPYHL